VVCWKNTEIVIPGVSCSCSASILHTPVSRDCHFLLELWFVEIVIPVVSCSCSASVLHTHDQDPVDLAVDTCDIEVDLADDSLWAVSVNEQVIRIATVIDDG
jgi:hypothetical protein